MKINVLLLAGLITANAATVSPSTFGKGSKSPKGSKSTILPKETKSGSFSPGKGSRSPPGKGSLSLPGKGKGSSTRDGNSTMAPTLAPTLAPTTMTIDEVAGSSSFPLRRRGRHARRRLRRGDGTGYSALKKKNKDEKTSKSSKGAKGAKSSYVGKNTTTAAPTSAPTLEYTEFNP